MATEPNAGEKQVFKKKIFLPMQECGKLQFIEVADS